jgi:CRP-like cAMP-binding protein
MKDELIKYLLEHRYISFEDQQLIASAFKYKEYKGGEWLIPAGRIASHLFFVNQGVLKIIIPHPTQRDVVYSFVKENHMMTFLYSMYGHIPCLQGLQAASKAQVLSVSYHDLLILFEQLPYLRALIDSIAQLSMAEMVSNNNQFAVGDAAFKYELFMKNEPVIAQLVPLTDIASYLGITLQSLSRIRKARSTS